jgi:hypothetical protein
MAINLLSPSFSLVMLDCAYLGYLRVIEWLHTHLQGELQSAFMFQEALEGGQVETCLWLQDHYPALRRDHWADGIDMLKHGHVESAKLMLGRAPRREQLAISDIDIESTLASGSLEMARWIFSSYPIAMERLSRSIRWLHLVIDSKNLELFKFFMLETDFRSRRTQIEQTPRFVFMLDRKQFVSCVVCLCSRFL